MTNATTVLDPREKMKYFKKHWPADLQAEVKACCEEVVRDSPKHTLRYANHAAIHALTV
jgi:hypothetical protein